MRRLLVLLPVVCIAVTLFLFAAHVWSEAQKVAAEQEKTKQAEAKAAVAIAQARKELARLNDDRPGKLAKLKDDLAKGEVKLKEAEAKTKAVQAQNDIKGRLIAIAHAYLDAQVALGRPPKEVAELKPHLKREEDLLSPRTQKPFVIAWNEDFLAPFRSPQSAKKVIVWAPEADQDGGRWVVSAPGTSYECTYVQEKEFQKLLQAVVPTIPIIPPAAAQK
jgi:hypothetical protein